MPAGPIQFANASFAPAQVAGPIQFANASFVPAQVAGPIQFANAAFTPARVGGSLQFAYADFLQGVQGEPTVGGTVIGEEFPVAGTVSGELINV